MSQELLYKIGVSLLPGVGTVTAKKIIAYCGGAQAVFKERQKPLLKIPGMKAETAAAIRGNKDVLLRAEKEIAFIEKRGVRPVFYLDKSYPHRLKHCDDGPVMLYMKGDANLDAERVLGVVGCRNATDYGKNMCDAIIGGLARHNVLIISGLAYGIDLYAHQSAVKYGLSTAGVLGHGLDRIYPPVHKPVADRMVKQGGALVTEFMSGTRPDKQNFPKRNRIVAGMLDALLVVESAEKGGSLITADIANSYNRDVFAVPGRTTDTQSAGCNKLIRRHKAALVESAADVEYLMGWSAGKRQKQFVQRQLFTELSGEESLLANILKESGELSIDELSVRSKISMGKVSALLLKMEFSGFVLSLPGKRYRLN